METQRLNCNLKKAERISFAICLNGYDEQKEGNIFKEIHYLPSSDYRISNRTTSKEEYFCLA